MKTVVELETGTLEVNGNTDGWIITSEQATLPAPNDDVVLRKGDRININGDVYRNGEMLANVA